MLLQSRAKYLHVAKQMKAYEDHLYEQWKEGVEAVLPSLLKRNLLIKPHEKQAPSTADAEKDRDKAEQEFGMWIIKF